MGAGWGGHVKYQVAGPDSCVLTTYARAFAYMGSLREEVGGPPFIQSYTVYVYCSYGARIRCMHTVYMVYAYGVCILFIWCTHTVYAYCLHGVRIRCMHTVYLVYAYGVCILFIWCTHTVYAYSTRCTCMYTVYVSCYTLYVCGVCRLSLSSPITARRGVETKHMWWSGRDALRERLVILTARSASMTLVKVCMLVCLWYLILVL